jgi:hypothetical protein
MSSGSGLFSRRLSAAPAVPTTQQSSSTTPLIPTSSSSSATVGEGGSEPHRRHGSAPLATAFGLRRRESVPSSPSNANASRRSLTLDLHSSRKISDPGIIHKPSPLSPKRKPLPKGSAFDKQMSSQDDGDLSGKLGKMELTGGSTMVISPNS